MKLTQPVLALVVLLSSAAVVSADPEEEGPVGLFASDAQPRPGNEIDEAVFSRLKRLGIEPAKECTDHVFVRRAYLDVVGTLPTAQEVRRFLVNKSPNKRAILIDDLLERDEFATYWAMKWGDLLRVKAEFPINLWPNAVQAYHRWIRTAIKQNMPYDRFVRELLTSSGSNFRVPPVNFYRAVQMSDAPTLAGAVALIARLRALILERRELHGALRASRADAARWRTEARDLLSGLGSAIDRQFERWELTPAEREVAMLLLKGLSHRDIAEMRGVSERTVRQQSHSVYGKAELEGRADLAAFFLEGLWLPD